MSGKCHWRQEAGHQGAACPKKQDWLEENGKGKGRIHIHEVTVEEGDFDMVTIEASTDELFG